MQFPFTSLLPFSTPTTLPHHSPQCTPSVSVQKAAGLPWTSTKHGISSCYRTKHPPPLY